MSRTQRIEDQLKQALLPIFLAVDNESNRHQVPEGAETHFKVTVVSSKFKGLNRIQRHRMVNQLLQEEFSLGLHALSLHLYTEEEWDAAGHFISKSPACKGGSKH